MNKLKTFLNLIKFEHSIFALPFAYLGLFLAADGLPSFRVFFWVTLAMVAIRTSGMTLNRLIDEPIDAKNPRTRSRIAALDELNRSTLWLVTLVAIELFVWSAAKLNPLCLKLSVIPIALVWAYPYLKKITWTSHFFLGIILGIAPYGGWLAASGEWSWTPLWLALSVVTWVAGFDMFYALQDVDFDRTENLKSFPARFGEAKTLLATGGLHLATIVLLATVGIVLGLGPWYWAGLVACIALIVREHSLVARFGLAKINEAFFNMNALVSVVIFLAVFLEIVT